MKITTITGNSYSLFLMARTCALQVTFIKPFFSLKEQRANSLPLFSNNFVFFNSNPLNFKIVLQLGKLF